MGKSRGKMGVYSSLITDQTRKLAKTVKTKAEAMKKRGPKEAANLRPLPKEQPARFFAHFRWERIKAYWFSKDGLKRMGKIAAAGVLLIIIGIGALFVYYKSQLKEIQLNDLTISETVNTYLDRNGEVLWEDKGDADYRLVVEGDQISTYARQATVAIEDRNFYNHPGVDLTALVRATLSTLTGKGVQGGSTLTQQLIKQVYFSDEAASKNRGGIARKIKELILSIELEKMYSKEQIITMYLNESPYGGRRNGIESAARTYFGKSAKELNLAESALLAAIPNNPSLYNPYNEYGHEYLLERQHKVLNDMVAMGYISEDEANVAKEVPILDQILPASNQYSDMKAPHFVIEVKKQLEEKYGMQTMRTGGYTIITTLDYRAQEMAEAAIAEGAKLLSTTKSDNLAMASVDVESAQVIAMVGSVDWNKPIYGEVNAATAQLEPGSTIKPVMDYATLYSLTGDKVYGPGTILKDENIDEFYCRGTVGDCQLRNYSGKFNGDITTRQSLGSSLNIGAVKALAISGIDNALETVHKLGDASYCKDNAAVGLSIAIGSGCTIRADEHANTYASIARGGVYKPLAYVLEVKDRSGKVLEKWTDSEGERAIDEQVAYEVASVLSDADARMIGMGDYGRTFGFVVPGVWTGTKTGTTTTANSAIPKDLWMMSFSTAVATAVWNGNHDGSGLRSGAASSVTKVVVGNYMENVHKNLYAKEGKWKSGDQPERPAGIQELTVNGKTDIWPSWYKKDKNATKEMMTFNQSNKLRAAECTPANLIIEVEVTRDVDPISGTESWYAPDGYNTQEIDTCQVADAPTITFTQTTNSSGNPQLVIKMEAGSFALESYKVLVDNVLTKSDTVTDQVLAGGVIIPLDSTAHTVRVEVTDIYDTTTTKTYAVGAGASSSAP